MRIVLTGGGTAGHLIPFEPIIEALRTLYLEQKNSLPTRLDPKSLELRYIGVADEKAREFFAHFDVAVTHVPSGKVRRYASARTVPDLLFFLPLGIIASLWHVWRLMPDVIISKGGYGSVPVLLAAVVYRIPIVLHESDAVSGLANTLTARFAAAICVGFTATYASLARYQFKTFVTGTPVRDTFGRLTAAEAKRIFNFSASEIVVLIIGGSQGASAINEVVLQVLPELILEAAVIHLTGEKHFAKISAVAAQLLENSSRREQYHVYPHLTDTIIAAMTAADVVVSRAGATTLAELTRLRKPSLLVPLPSAAHDHQRLNAETYERLGAARVLDQTNLGKNIFLRSVRELIGNKQLRQELAANMAQLDRPTAAREIAGVAIKLAQGLVPKK